MKKSSDPLSVLLDPDQQVESHSIAKAGAGMPITTVLARRERRANCSIKPATERMNTNQDCPTVLLNVGPDPVEPNGTTAQIEFAFKADDWQVPRDIGKDVLTRILPDLPAHILRDPEFRPPVVWMLQDLWRVGLIKAAQVVVARRLGVNAEARICPSFAGTDYTRCVDGQLVCPPLPPFENRILAWAGPLAGKVELPSGILDPDDDDEMFMDIIESEFPEEVQTGKPRYLDQRYAFEKALSILTDCQHEWVERSRDLISGFWDTVRKCAASSDEQSMSGRSLAEVLSLRIRE